jgi:hypothetical protein
MFMLGFALLATTTLLPLFVQTELGYTATDAGLVMSPGGFTVMLMMPVVGMLVAKVDARLLLAVGFAGTALALYSMTRFYGAVDYATIAWARVYQSSALALLFIPINTTALAGMPAAKSNNASAIINMMRNIGGSFGISAVTTLIARREQYHQNVLVAHATPLSTPYEAAIGTLQQALSRLYRQRRRRVAAGRGSGLRHGAAAGGIAVVQRLFLGDGGDSGGHGAGGAVDAQTVARRRTAARPLARRGAGRLLRRAGEGAGVADDAPPGLGKARVGFGQRDAQMPGGTRPERVARQHRDILAFEQAGGELPSGNPGAANVEQ